MWGRKRKGVLIKLGPGLFPGSFLFLFPFLFPHLLSLYLDWLKIKKEVATEQVDQGSSRLIINS
jgi:hypothetical protein